MFADLNIFCKLLDEFYPENIYAGENFDEFVAVHAALRHAKATLLRANGGISVGSMATERDETWWRARAEREEGHFIAAGAAPAQNADMVEDQAIIINSLLIRLNNRLVDMKPEWDDSLTGFNDAMDIVRDALKNPIVFTRRGMVPQP
jgi:hypothetical protein